MIFLARIRLAVIIMLLLLGIAAFGPAIAQKLNPDGAPNPTASVTSERELFKQVPRIEGRIDIPDKKASVLIQPAGRTWDYFHEVLLHWGGAIVILGTIALLGLAYLIIGRVRIAEGRSGKKILRFKALERFSHWLTAASFVVLGLTGLNITFGKILLLPVVGPDAFSDISQGAKYVHNFTSFSFVVGLILITMIFFRDNFLAGLISSGSSRAAASSRTNMRRPDALILARSWSIGSPSSPASQSPSLDSCCCFLFTEPTSSRCSSHRSCMPSWPSCSSP